MSLFVMTGNDFIRSIKAGCIKLEHNRDSVDLLNVFPVPDGDTGTNMYLTLMSAVREGEKNRDQPLGKLAKSVSMGSLMGARGNSGVILSQIFRGMARVLEGKEQAGAMEDVYKRQLMGELSLDGSLQSIRGVLPIAINARKEGFEGFILPKQNAREAAVVDKLKVYGAENIREVIDRCV